MSAGFHAPLKRKHGLWRHGRSTVTAIARAMLEGGAGLSELEVQRWYARCEALTQAYGKQRPQPAHIAEFRALLEARNTLR